MGINYGLNYPMYNCNPYMPYGGGYGMMGYGPRVIGAPSEDLYEAGPKETQASKDKSFLTNAALVAIGLVAAGFGGKVLLKVPKLIWSATKAIAKVPFKLAGAGAKGAGKVAEGAAGATATVIDVAQDAAKATVNAVKS